MEPKPVRGPYSPLFSLLEDRVKSWSLWWEFVGTKQRHK